MPARVLTALACLTLVACAHRGRAPVAAQPPAAPSTPQQGPEAQVELEPGVYFAAPMEASATPGANIAAEPNGIPTAREGRYHRAWRHCNEELCDCPRDEEFIWARGADGRLYHGSARCSCAADACGEEPTWPR